MPPYSDVCVFDCSASYCRSDVDSESEITKLNLLANERLESFWHALWFCIRTFLCLIVECLHLISDIDSESETTKLYLLPNECPESFWHALWLCIRTPLCLTVECLIVEVMLTQKVRSQN